MTPLIESAMDGKQLVVRARARKAFAGLAALGLAVILLAASVVTPVLEDPSSSASTHASSEATTTSTGDAGSGSGTQSGGEGA